MADLTGRNADETKPDIATWGTGNVLETGEGTVKVDLDNKASLSAATDDVDITGGKINGTPIGDDSRSSGKFTSLGVSGDIQKNNIESRSIDVTPFTSGSDVTLFTLENTGDIALQRGTGVSLLINLNVSAENSDRQTTSQSATFIVNFSFHRRFTTLGGMETNNVVRIASARQAGGAILFSSVSTLDVDVSMDGNGKVTIEIKTNINVSSDRPERTCLSANAIQLSGQTGNNGRPFTFI